MEKSYVITAYASKTIQLVVFTGLIFVLLFRRIKGTGQIGKLPILIAIFALANAVSAILRVDAMWPLLHETKENSQLFDVTFFLESVFFFGATWFFAIKYYETASDLEHLLSEQPRDQ